MTMNAVSTMSTRHAIAARSTSKEVIVIKEARRAMVGVARRAKNRHPTATMAIIDRADGRREVYSVTAPEMDDIIAMNQARNGGL